MCAGDGCHQCPLFCHFEALSAVTALENPTARLDPEGFSRAAQAVLDLVVVVAPSSLSSPTRGAVPRESEGFQEPHMDPNNAVLNPGPALPTTEVRGTLFITSRHTGQVSWLGGFSPGQGARSPRLILASPAGSLRQEAALTPGSRGRCTWEEKHFAGGRKQDLTYKQHPQWLSK